MQCVLDSMFTIFGQKNAFFIFRMLKLKDTKNTIGNETAPLSKYHLK